MNSDLVLIGGGGHAAELYSYLADLVASGSEIKLLGIVDEGLPKGPWAESRVIGGVLELSTLINARPDPLLFLTAVGDNRVRQQLVRKIESLSGVLLPWTLRHPSATVGRLVEIGAGTLLAPGSIITTRSRIGAHCILNANASVHHDCVVKDYVNINPGATIAGKVRIGEGVSIGAGATVIDGISIGDWSVIGAGAVVTKNVPAYVTAVGVPARVIKSHGGPGVH